MSWNAFLEAREPRPDQLFLFEEFGSRSFYEPDYPEDAMLVFGQETKGIPRSIIESYEDRLFHLPMRSDVIRSLNLANTVSAAAYQALRGKL
jgi:tRNA (cytidine/uridine-2'-O-)-methyltransferase